MISPSSSPSLAPSILLAAPGLDGGIFEQSVILLGKHSKDGALGWIINGQELPPVGELLASAELLPEGLSAPKTEAFSFPARIGGPVAPETGWLLYAREEASFEREIEVGDSLAITGDSDALSAVIAGDEPHKFHLLLGYAGWGPGQLEEEMRQGSWLPTDVNPELLFPRNGKRLSSKEIWDTAYRSVLGSKGNIFGGGNWGSA